ncbi:trafficking kinesin-binding protein 1-like isoform X2 [Erpetoichthys calabaricus]|uniref:trafficking kinesin-binding protein 1-like isoform X2 n=1 Tax=Erpetoichthys calabaricus TaxID=27687 RepID=UPI0022348A9B|nr:trafficking kinesin-binding protein 1-like isoform X2 [Erpetoichthys calabaricus]
MLKWTLADECSDSHIGVLCCLPDQVGSYSSAHGSLLFPVNPTKLATSGISKSQPAAQLLPEPALDPKTSPLLLQDVSTSHISQMETEEDDFLTFNVPKTKDEFIVPKRPDEQAHYDVNFIICGEASSSWDLSTTSVRCCEQGNYCDVSTITDVCNTGNVPEVEIISLLEEQLPSYTLRADCVFGYDHDDWLHTPLIPPEVNINLTPEQIEETLKYFLLCSERVGQVTKTYHDIEAVTHLLEEKERDLELAARIGQSLLKSKRSLTETNELLEEQLDAAREEIAQLRHELSMRDDLLHIYTSNVEDSDTWSAFSTPLRHSESSTSLQSSFQFDFLQQKLKGLEEENLKLRTEANDLENETTTYEEQEQQLMLDCMQELASANKQMSVLSDDLARKVEDTVRQQEEISQLLAQIVDQQQRNKILSRENEELTQHLLAAREGQQQLKCELSDVREKYSECKAILHEAQEEIKNLRNKTLPNSTINRYGALNIFPLDSLAAEIEDTMRKGLDSPTTPEYKNHQKRVFETVKAVNQVVRFKSLCPSPQIPGSGQSSTLHSTLPSPLSTPRTSYYGSDSASMLLEDKPPGSPTLPGSSQPEGQDKKPGQPGTPGGHDLEAALRRLSARQESHSSERPFFEVERERKLRTLAADSEICSSGFLTPDESVLSTGTNYSGSSEHSGGSSISHSSRSYYPDRLQIVKPLEGSVTLHHWQQLARPNLGGILDPRPGVLTKDFMELDVDMQEIYSLNDLEEDEMDPASSFTLAGASSLTGKQGNRVCQSGHNLPQTLPTHTITMCRIMHPLAEPNGLPNQGLSSRWSSGKLREAESSLLNQCRPSESVTRQRAHTWTLSTSLGLARLLQEQGISAASGHRWEHQLLSGPPWNTSFCSPPGKHETRGGAFAQPGVTKPAAATGPVLRTQSYKNIFSINLLEKLKSLGLDKVAARGLITKKSGAKESPAQGATGEHYSH